MAGPPQRHRARTALLISVIVVGALVVTGGVAWGAVSVGRAIAHRITAGRPPVIDRGGPPVADGTRIGTRWAPSPLVCDDECFILGDATASAGPDEFARNLTDTPEVSDYGVYSASSPLDDYDDLLRSWRDAEPSGDDCMFTFDVSPSAAQAAVRPVDDHSTMQFLDGYQGHDEYPVLQTGARAFPDSAAADAYVHSLQDVIAACRHYRLSAKDDPWNAQVSALSGWGALPDDITAIGWVEQEARGDGMYGVDLERGNLAVRYTLATDHLSRDGFQRFVSHMATLLERAKHSPGVAG
jgi:hypothetical protein